MNFTDKEVRSLAHEGFRVKKSVLTKYIGNREEIHIPEGIESIGEKAFEACTCIKTLVIPDSVTEIGERAFVGCTELESIIIPESVVKIGTWALEDTPWYDKYFQSNMKNPYVMLNNVLIKYMGTERLPQIPENTVTIGIGAFADCSEITALTTNENLQLIDDEAFVDCKNLSSVKIGDSVVSLGSSVFKGCTSLCDVTLNSQITAVTTQMFYGCKKLKELTIPNNIKTIGESAFTNCSAFTKLTLPDGVTTLEERCFVGCTSLRDIEIPESVVSIGLWALEDTPWYDALLEATFEQDFVMINNVIARYNGSEPVLSLPATVQSIGPNAFADCTNITAVAIPKSVLYISANAFQDCVNLKSLSILGNPNVHPTAFEGCPLSGKQLGF